MQGQQCSWRPTVVLTEDRLLPKQNAETRHQNKQGVTNGRSRRGHSKSHAEQRDGETITTQPFIAVDLTRFGAHLDEPTPMLVDLHGGCALAPFNLTLAVGASSPTVAVERVALFGNCVHSAKRNERRITELLEDPKHRTQASDAAEMTGPCRLGLSREGRPDRHATFSNYQFPET